MEFPLPGMGQSVVAVPAPGRGPGCWAGAPSAMVDTDGTLVVAYRLRFPERRGAMVMVSRSADGERLQTVASLDKAHFGADSLERPALARTETGRWRLYVSCATPGSKHWWIALLEAADPDELQGAEIGVGFGGDEHTGVKDPVIRRRRNGWEGWICCHPLDEPGEEDSMTTAYATSGDGVTWDLHGTVLAGRPGSWDARGARVTAVLPDGRASYDGRATKKENFCERTGLARQDGRSGQLVALIDAPVSGARYLDVVRLCDGRYRLYYEAPLPDGSHELRTEIVPAQSLVTPRHQTDPRRKAEL